MPVTIVSGAAHRRLAVPLRALVALTLKHEGRRTGEIGIRLTDDAELREVNRRWRGIDRATDVISFAYDENEPDALQRPVGGDLVISMDRVHEQAKRYRETAGAELARLVIHGVLHLGGHDHARAGERARMRKREDAILASARVLVRRLAAAARTAALVGVLALALAGRAHAAADAPPAPAMASVEALRESMLASDSILVAHVSVDLVESTDSLGAPKTTWNTKRQFVNQVKSPWMKRFAALFLPQGAQLLAQPCPTPRPVGGTEKPWMVTALWITPSGRGQAYLDFSSMCGIAGLAGTKPAGVDLGAHADSLFALFREALYADTLLSRMRLDAPPPNASDAPGTMTAPMPPPAAGGHLRLSDNVGVAHLPEPLHKVVPVYPKAARDAGVEGTVVVIALVGADGKVAQAQIEDGIGLLDLAALTAVRKWTFTPARTVEGSPIAARVLVPVTFSLQEGAGKPAH